MSISTANPYLFKEHREGKKGEKILVPVRFSRSRLGKRGHRGGAKDWSFCPIPSDQSTQILSMKLVRKADSFHQSADRFAEGRVGDPPRKRAFNPNGRERLSRARQTPLVVSRAERIDTNRFESMKVTALLNMTRTYALDNRLETRIVAQHVPFRHIELHHLRAAFLLHGFV